MEQKYQILRGLADGAIERIKKLPQPVTRVIGPLTTSAYGYDDNLRRFIAAQNILREKGYTVFDYFEGHNDEEVIKSLQLPWEDIMEQYHRPILDADCINDAWFLPRWEFSNGAKWEHAFASTHGYAIHYFPDEWFPEELQGQNLSLV